MFSVSIFVFRVSRCSPHTSAHTTYIQRNVQLKKDPEENLYVAQIHKEFIPPAQAKVWLLAAAQSG